MVAIENGTPLREVGTIVLPLLDLTIESILKFSNNVFVFAMHAANGEKPFTLKGKYQPSDQQHWIVRGDLAV